MLSEGTRKAIDNISVQIINKEYLDNGSQEVGAISRKVLLLFVTEALHSQLSHAGVEGIFINYFGESSDRMASDTQGTHSS